MNDQMIVTLQKELNILVIGNEEFGECSCEQIIDMHIQMDD